MVHLCLSVELIHKFRDSVRLKGTGFHFCKIIEGLQCNCQRIFQFNSPSVNCYLRIDA